jgi:hypothetical protein
VSYFELAAHQLALPTLEPGQGTVGSHIDVRHLAAWLDRLACGFSRSVAGMAAICTRTAGAASIRRR